MESYEFARKLDVGESTLRKYCKALETQGYIFEKGDYGKRIFTESDLIKLKEYKRNLLSLKLGYQEAARITLNTIQVSKEVSEIEVKEWYGERVVTFRDIDEAHGRVEGTAKRNFHKNKEHLCEGEDYFVITHKEFSTKFVPNHRTAGNPKNEVILLTQSGYLLLVKSFTDNLSWDVQKNLVSNYFKLKSEEKYLIPVNFAEALRLAADLEEQKQKLETEKLLLEQQVAEYEPRISYLDKILESKDSLIVSQVSEDYGLTAHSLNKILHEEGIQYKRNRQWLLYEQHKGLGYTDSKTVPFRKNNGEECYAIQTRWTQKGRVFIHSILEKRGIYPVMDRNKA